jgi:hypothetical protein
VAGTEERVALGEALELVRRVAEDGLAEQQADHEAGGDEQPSTAPR